MENGEVKAFAVLNEMEGAMQSDVKAFAVLNEMEGAMQSDRFGWIKQDWKLVSASSEADNHQAALAFDEQAYSYWLSKPGKNQSIVIDLGASRELKGFAYTPQTSVLTAIAGKRSKILNSEI